MSANKGLTPYYQDEVPNSSEVRRFTPLNELLERPGARSEISKQEEIVTSRATWLNSI